MAKKTNYHELTAQEQQTYRFAVLQVLVNNANTKSIMSLLQVNTLALQMVHAVNLTIMSNEPIVNNEKEMD